MPVQWSDRPLIGRPGGVPEGAAAAGNTARHPAGREPGGQDVTERESTGRDEMRNDVLGALPVIAGALADETRLRILLLLAAGELNVTQLCERLGCMQSTVSHHVAILKRTRLVESRRDGKMIYYRVGGIAAAPAGDTIRIRSTGGGVTIQPAT